MKKIIKRLLTTILSMFLVTLVLVLYAPFTLRSGYRDATYAHVMKDAAISGDTKVVDIAMLGAHDAFSHNINLRSKPDPGDQGIVQNKAINAFFKGGIVRVSKAQTAGAKTLLNRGVRYFDVRVSRVGETWFTKHGLLDSELKHYVGEIYEFLKDKPEEFIVFDIQHIYLGDASISMFLDYLAGITLIDGGLNLNHFLHYTSNIPLADLEYFDVQGVERGGIIILLNDDGSATPDQQKLFYPRGDGEDNTISIRSKWHNQRKVDAIIPLIDEEEAYLESQVVTTYFRVNQAQLTPDYLKDPIGTLLNWSLINLAAKSNERLLNHDHFNGWLEEMPIFMVDFSNSRKGDFNEIINEKMIAYNQLLST